MNNLYWLAVDRESPAAGNKLTATTTTTRRVVFAQPLSGKFDMSVVDYLDWRFAIRGVIDGFHSTQSLGCINSWGAHLLSLWDARSVRCWLIKCRWRRTARNRLTCPRNGCFFVCGGAQLHTSNFHRREIKMRAQLSSCTRWSEGVT